MKTLDFIKSENLFYKIKSLGDKVSMLSGVVQNPDFVNEENAQENYDWFYCDYKRCISELREIKDNVFELHNEIIK